MNAPFHAVPPPTGSRDELRAFIGEALEMAFIQAQQGVTYAATGDDVGLGYSLRKLVAYTRAAVETMRDLAEQKGGGHGE